LAKYQQRDFPGALAAYEKAVEVFEFQSGDPKNLFPQRKLASVFCYTADVYRDLAKNAGGAEHQKNSQKAKENYRRAEDIFLKLESQNALTEADRKYLDETRAALQKYQ
jgi:hypothetical protein